jgi:hypothetical protein
LKITPNPTPEEAAAIAAALESTRDGKPEKSHNLKRSRWRAAGLLGHPPPDRMKPGSSLWSYSRWEGMV